MSLPPVQPGEWLTAASGETTTVLEVAPRYRDVDGQSLYVGRFWGMPGTVGTRGVVSGPGFRALADEFQPGTRLIVTARLELPEPEPAP